MVLGRWPRQAVSERFLWNSPGEMEIDFAGNRGFTCRFGILASELRPLLYLPRPGLCSEAGERAREQAVAAGLALLQAPMFASFGFSQLKVTTCEKKKKSMYVVGKDGASEDVTTAHRPQPGPCRDWPVTRCIMEANREFTSWASFLGRNTGSGSLSGWLL